MTRRVMGVNTTLQHLDYNIQITPDLNHLQQIDEFDGPLAR